MKFKKLKKLGFIKFKMKLLLVLFTCLQSYIYAQKVLFVVGADGTVGFYEGWHNHHKASITDYSTRNSNHGWGEFADILSAEGYILEEVTENATSGVNFNSMDLSEYNLIVFGSNNQSYSNTQVNAVMDYINNGGSALFISDANFGSSWSDAPDSDQHFLDRLGWAMNQDREKYVVRESDYITPSHPILDGISSFEGEGVSPITLIDDNVSGVSSTIVTRPKLTIRNNDRVDRQGSLRDVRDNDASLIVATVGQGRVAGHFDRNTFFNTNGAGSNIHKYDNTQYALNLFGWLTKKNGETEIVPVTSVSLSPNTASIYEGTTQSLSTLVNPANASNKRVNYASNNTAVASVSSSGIVTALSEGVATIIVTTDDGNFTDSTEITVLANVVVPNLALNKPISGTGTPDGEHVVANIVDGLTTTRWSVLRFPQTAIVDLGEIYAIQRTELICIDDRDYQYTVSVSNTEDGTYVQVVDRSNNTTPGAEIAPITDVFPKVNGRYVKITVTGAHSYGGNWVSLKEFRVFGDEGETVAVTGVSLSPNTVNMFEGATHPLSASVSPVNASNKGVSYESNNTTVASVDASGIVTAISEGISTITVTTDDGSFTASTEIIVRPDDLPASRQYFDKNNDLLLANFDLMRDEDDVMASAALGCMLLHEDLEGVNYYVVAGTIGTQSGTFINIAVPDYYNNLFGVENTNWSNANADWDGSVERATNKAKTVLDAGGKVFVQDAGQSDFTYDVVQALINDEVSLSTIQTNIIVVQHSISNEGSTTASKLEWLRNNTDYNKIDDGNYSNNDTPGYRTDQTVWLSEAKSRSNPNTKARDYWVEADAICDAWDPDYTNVHINRGGVDFSDNVECWWIFDLGNKVNSISDFWDRYVTNETRSLSTTYLDNTAKKDGFLYPNPAYSEKKTITIKNIDAYTDIALIDINGHVISSQAISGSEFEMSIANLNASIYFVRLSNQYKTVTKKLIVR